MVIFQRSFALTATSGQLYQAEVTTAEAIFVILILFDPVLSLSLGTHCFGDDKVYSLGKKMIPGPFPSPFPPFRYIELECIWKVVCEKFEDRLWVCSHLRPY